MKWADVDLTQHQDVDAADHYSTTCKETIDDGFLIYSGMFTPLIAEPHLFLGEASIRDNIFDRVRAWWAKTIVEHRFAEVCPATQLPPPSTQ